MAAPPIPVTSPGGPDTPEGPIILPANCAVVASTFVILDWQPAAAAPGGGAQVQLPTFAAVKAFLPFCRLSRNPADIAAAGAVNVLEVRLTDAAWSRIFTEMEAAQVFSQNFRHLTRSWQTGWLASIRPGSSRSRCARPLLERLSFERSSRTALSTNCRPRASFESRRNGFISSLAGNYPLCPGTARCAMAGPRTRLCTPAQSHLFGPRTRQCT